MSDKEAFDAGGPATTTTTCMEGGGAARGGDRRTMPDESRTSTADKRKAADADLDHDPHRYHHRDDSSNSSASRENSADRDCDEDNNNHDGQPEVKKKFVMCRSLRNEEARHVKAEDDSKQSQSQQKSAPIKMSLNTQKKMEVKAPVIRKSAAVAKAFNPDEESDEEEMPPEAKMRMRNIGRDTPTAAGPNSYGKGRLGFCDRQKIFEREIKKKTDTSSN
ncbi:PEST proteolytic signal-containing nuclear protein-like isoform X1 [Argonauta hians]